MLMSVGVSHYAPLIAHVFGPARSESFSPLVAAPIDI